MTDSQPALRPLVFASFKLPPNHQSFLQIRETLWSIFIPQLDNLNLALEAAQIIHSSTSTTKILYEARKAAVDEVEKLWDYFNIVEGIAERYIEFLVSLSRNDLRKRRYAYRTACLLARAGTSDSGKAQQVMTNFREGIEDAITRMICTMAGDNEDILSFIKESSRILAEITSATDKCIELLDECRQDFMKLEMVDFEEESFLSDPPLEEYQVALQKWHVFVKTARSLSASWSKLRNGIAGEESPYTGLDKTPEEDSLDTRNTTNGSLFDVWNPSIWTDNSSCRTGPITSASASTPSNPSLSTSIVTPVWRRILRRMAPCL